MSARTLAPETLPSLEAARDILAASPFNLAHSRNTKMATKSNRKPRVPKVYPDEQKLQATIDGIKNKAKDRDKTADEKAKLAEANAALGSLRFIRLAEARTKVAIKAIGMLLNLGAKQYVRTEEDIAAVVDALRGAVNAVADALGGKTKVETEFKLRNDDDPED